MSNSQGFYLLHVADMVTARFEGVSLPEIRKEIGCDHRTEQRIMRAFEAVFPQALAAMGEAEPC